MTPEEFRKIYLFMYNLFQLVGFTYIFAILCLRYAVEGPASMEGSYTTLGSVMKFLHILQVLEVVHPLLGYTKGSWFFASLQVAYRLFIIIVLLDGEPRMQTKPVVFYLFLIWTASELLR